MKKTFILFCFALSASAVQSQSGGQYNSMSNYVQPAPNAAALGKYVDYPISYYTGTPNISVPLYNLKDGAANISVSLSYHPSGIRLAEMSSWVGLGWALNAGGMITRTIKGAPDEGSKVTGTGTPPRGYWVDSGLTKMAHLPNPNGGYISAADSNLQMAQYTIWQITSGASDGEPDIFSFNFNGYSGKFVFDEYRVPRLLSTQDILINVSMDGTTGSFGTWVFTTPDGAKYYFGEGSKYEISTTVSNGVTDPNSTYPSSWLLTKIVYPNSKDTVYYNYSAESYSYFDLGQESRLFYGGSVTGGDNVLNACSISDPIDLPHNIYKTTVSGQRLTSIVSPNYTIKFVPGAARQDLIGASNTCRLDSVKVFTAGGKCIRQALLSYSYFQSTTSNNFNSYITGPLNGDTTDTKRLKLLSVKEFSGDGASANPPYIFKYQETYQLPRRLCYDQDHWGYSNNYNGGSNNKFTPQVHHSICNNVGMGFTAAWREPSWPAMQAFSIKSIKDPLGVITAFEFEPHVSTQPAPDTLVGGLRIHAITITDSVTGMVQTRSFNYGPGGVLYRAPQYLVTPKNEFYWQGYSWPIISSTYRGYSFDHNDLFFLLRQSQSIVPMQDFQGNHIGYPIVKEIFGPNGEGGSKVYYFMADQNVRDNSRLDMSNFTAASTVSNGSLGVPETGLFGNGQWNNIPPENLTYYGGYNVNYYYPYAPQQVDFRRGQLMSEETYDSSHVLLKDVINTYTSTFNEKYWIRGFKAHRVTPPNGTLRYDALTFYKLHTGISHLVATKSVDYKDGKSMVSITRYGYESGYHTQKTSDTTVNSTGDTLINKTYYSFDYTGAADNVFAKMKARNLLMPVSSRTWKNNQLIGGTITKFSDFASSSADTFINPAKMYALETSAPMSTGAAGENIALTTQFTTLLPNGNFIEKASFDFNGGTGRIMGQHLSNDKNQAMIWDNNLRLPLAQVDNAYSSDVAFTSFESSGTGNWTYTGAIVTDTTAPTGNKAYTISSSPITKTGLNASQKYVFSFWAKSGGSVSPSGGSWSNYVTGKTINGWTYYELEITGTTSLSVGGTGSIDEVRLYPATAQMTSYTYDALLRLTATCSPNSLISHYEYDSFNRLVDIKDTFGNIIKVFEYNYGQLSR